jgi:peptidoglycan/LPS O-acetylase OafA/YrhL
LTPSPVPENKSSSAPSRLHYLDALRGIACLGVLIFHNSGGIPPVTSGKLYLHVLHAIVVRGLGYGWLGVSMFLVLSGFCLFYPIVRKVPVSEARVDFPTFLKRRAWRILPPYYASIAILYFPCSFSVRAAGASSPSS